MGTGWLGWTPQVTRRASIFDIEMAFKGKRQFLRATVMGFPDEDEPDTTVTTVKNGVLDRDAVAEKTKNLFGMFAKKTPARKRSVA